jgi:CRP-like cAMP-binding protein
MALTVRDLRVDALRRSAAGDAAAALYIYDHLLAANPLDYGARLRIADLLVALGDHDGAAAVYAAVAEHDMRSGHPLPAIVAVRALEALGAPHARLVDRLAALYGQGGATLGRVSSRQAPIDFGAEVEPVDLPGADAAGETMTRARDRALDLGGLTNYPEQLLPVPFLSELPPALFSAVVEVLIVRRLGAGDLVVREGEVGNAFFLMAAGEAVVFATDAVGNRVERARIHENALFGEMALLSAQPRSASVAVVDEADVLELTREALEGLTAAHPPLAEALDRFARERLLKNLLATSPLFRPFSRQQQLDLIRRFEGHDVAPGTAIIREGEPGLGIYAVLAGEVEVVKRSSEQEQQGPGGDVLLARLGPGDLFGEMSLLSDQPTNASVRAVGQSTILFLDRTYFQRLVDALPELRRYFEALAERRDVETRLLLGEDEQDDDDPSVLV